MLSGVKYSRFNLFSKFAEFIGSGWYLTKPIRSILNLFFCKILRTYKLIRVSRLFFKRFVLFISDKISKTSLFNFVNLGFYILNIFKCDTIFNKKITKNLYYGFY